MLPKRNLTAMTLALGILIAGNAYADPQHGPSYGFGGPGNASDVTRTIDIEMMDNSFNHRAMDIKPGETIRFNIHNNGNVMHEFGIAMPNMHKDRETEMMGMMNMGMMNMEGFNADMMSQNGMMPNRPDSVLVEPGKSAELVWHFDKMEGIEFACNVPGHYEDGMRGPFMFQN